MFLEAKNYQKSGLAVRRNDIPINAYQVLIGTGHVQVREVVRVIDAICNKATITGKVGCDYPVVADFFFDYLTGVANSNTFNGRNRLENLENRIRMRGSSFDRRGLKADCDDTRHKDN